MDYQVRHVCGHENRLDSIGTECRGKGTDQEGYISLVLFHKHMDGSLLLVPLLYPPSYRKDKGKDLRD